MLSRFVRIQLVIFSIASVVGIFVMAFSYMQLQSLAGIGRYNVTLDLPDTGGLYRFSNVTYRGVQVGRVTDVELTKTGVRAKMSLDSSMEIPADLSAVVRSVSAVGEQYVDLLPHTDSAPYLHDGSVVRGGPDAVPPPIGPMMDRASDLVATLPKDKAIAIQNTPTAHDPSHAPDHMISSIVGASLTLPVRGGELVLGTWQRVLFVECNGPRSREVVITSLQA